MGSLATIISAISNDVVLALAAASYPPLTPDASGNPGAILVGTAAAFEQSSPPRIIFEPVGSTFGAAEYASASTSLDTDERKHQNSMRTIATDNVAFNVRCWGAAGTRSPVDDYDVTRALYHAVRASIHKLLPGAYAVEATGKYPPSTNVVRSGREFVFGVVFFTPVLATLVPYDRDRLYAPDGVTPLGSVVLDSGTTEGIPVS